MRSKFRLLRNTVFQLFEKNFIMLFLLVFGGKNKYLCPKINEYDESLFICVYHLGGPIIGATGLPAAKQHKV